MANIGDLMSAWNTSTVDRMALLMPLIAAVISMGVGIIAFAHHDNWTGAFAVIAAIVTASGALATSQASRKRDAQLAFWVQMIDDIDRREPSSL